MREQELCTLGRTVAYKSHSGIIRAGSRHCCSLGKAGRGPRGGAHLSLSQNLPRTAGLKAKARGRDNSSA